MPRRRIPIDDAANQQLDTAIQISRQKIAGLAEALGCNRKTLYKWLDGTNAIPRDKLQRLCELLHLPEEQRVEQFEQRGYTTPPMASKPSSPLLIPRQHRAAVSDFVGREYEIAQLVAALEPAENNGNVVAISGVRGMGGIGKTELAFAIAQRLAPRFPDGTIVVTLHGMGSEPLGPTAAIQYVLRAFENNTKFPDDLEALQGLYRSSLAGKRVLILADDARDAAQVRPLIPPSGSALFITSRQRFAMPGMTTLDLDALPAAEAERLVLAICPRIDDAAPQLAQLCGYLPLALRTSASVLASSESLDVKRYLVRLQNAQLQALRDPDHPDDPQASIEASLALSYAALETASQAAFCQLGVFPGSFDLLAAAAVLNGETEVVEATLDLLHRRSLIQWDAERQRYAMHDLVRAFAQTRLQASDDSDARLRHATYFMQLAEQAEEQLAGQERISWLARLDRESANLWAALQWTRVAGERMLEVQLAAALVPYWVERTDISRGYSWLQQALRAATSVPPALRAKALAGLGAIARIEGDLPEAQSYYEQGLTLFLELRQQPQEARILFELGLLATDRDNDPAARDFFEASYVHFQQLGDQGRMGAALSGLGRIALNEGDRAAGHAYYLQAYTLLRESDNLREYAWVQLNLGRHHSEVGEFAQALGYIEASIDLFRTLQHSQGIAWSLFRKALVLSYDIDYEQATTFLHESLALFRSWGTKVGIAWCLCILSQVALKQDDTMLADRYARDALPWFQDVEYLPGVVLCLKNSAMAFAQTRPLPAVTLFGAVEQMSVVNEDVRASIGTGSPFYDKMIARTRDQLDEATFTNVWNVGKALSLEEAIAIAMS